MSLKKKRSLYFEGNSDPDMLLNTLNQCICEYTIHVCVTQDVCGGGGAGGVHVWRLCLSEHSASVSVLVLLQVLHAQKAGYKAAIVHNVDSDDLISMGSNDRKFLHTSA